MRDPAPQTLARTTHPSVNGPACLRLAEALECHVVPWLGFNMNFVMCADEDGIPPEPDHSGHNCGSVGCIAGWAHVVLGDATLQSTMREEGAAGLLGLDWGRARALFIPRHTDFDGEFPQPVYDRVYNATPQQAAAVLRHLAATGEVRWDLFV